MNNLVGKKSFLSKLQMMMLLACASSTANTNESSANITEQKEITPTIDSDVISTDGFAKTDNQGKAIIGNGSGDLVLVVYDSSGMSPRKKSFLLDLSFEDEHGKINDLTLNDISTIKKTISISNPKLTSFIESSKTPSNLIWQVFAIANHYALGDQFGDINLINFGLATTELNKRSTPLSHQALHQSKVHRASLIHNNITYGINSNTSLVSFTGEPSAFNMSIHNTLVDGQQVTGQLNQALFFGVHKLRINNGKSSLGDGFTTDYQALGQFKITQSDSDKNWQLIFSVN